MARSKERSEVEYLRSLLKGLKAENRYLKKELARLSKRQHQYEDLEEKIQEIDDYEEQKKYVSKAEKNCPECNEGKLEAFDLGARVMLRCTSCTYRIVKK